MKSPFTTEKEVFSATGDKVLLYPPAVSMKSLLLLQKALSDTAVTALLSIADKVLSSTAYKVLSSIVDKYFLPLQIKSFPPLYINY